MIFFKKKLHFLELTRQDLKVLIPVCLTVIFIDLLTKKLVFDANVNGYYICSILNILKVKNYGISFGLFHENPDVAIYFIVILDLLIIAYLLSCFKKTNQYLNPVLFASSVSLILGGAFGNLIDRLYYGFVRDFIDLHINVYHWPCFNIADSCICVGAGILVVCELFFRKK